MESEKSQLAGIDTENISWDDLLAEEEKASSTPAHKDCYDPDNPTDYTYLFKRYNIQ